MTHRSLWICDRCGLALANEVAAPMTELRDMAGTVWAHMCAWCNIEVFPDLAGSVLPTAEQLGSKPS